MSHPDHDRIMQILGDALERAPDERAAFVTSACAEDHALRAEVERLLSRERAAAMIVTAPVTLGMTELEAAVTKQSTSFRHPERIGPYRIVRALGEGGMGLVYLAEQESPVRRTVAIKLIRPGMDSDEVVARFQSERQAMALMTHPNVARVFDAGTTDTGRPYFVMEYVDGIPITTYCDGHALDVPQRLDLFVSVCDAVQHAHQKGIIHRDIKPSNVLVTVFDEKPVPKVIDFGVAKAVEQKLTEHTLYTTHGALVGTPEYMSPEQASAGATQVDTRTDVYGLGVLLYELLAGTVPFAHTQLRQAGYDEVRRIIREVDPPLPSARLVSSTRNTALIRTVRGDLDWITMKALEKDPNRRYATPADLAADIQRYRRFEPVTAGAPSTMYRVRKFVRRHRVPVVATSLILLALIGGLIGTAYQAIRAMRAEAHTAEQKVRAERRFDDVRKLAGSFMFDVDDTLQRVGPTKAREKLVNTSLEYLDSLASESTDDPDLLRDLFLGYQRVGSVQYFPGTPSLGDPKGALASFTKALECAMAWRKLTNPADITLDTDVATARSYVGVAHFGAGECEEAITDYTAAMSIVERVIQAKPDDRKARLTAAVLHDYISEALDQMNRNDEAMAHCKTAMEARLQILEAEPQNTDVLHSVALSHSNIGRMLAKTGRYDEAVRYCEMALSMHRELLGRNPESPVHQRHVMEMLEKLTTAYNRVGRKPEGLRAGEESLSILKKLAASDPASVRTQRDLAGAHQNFGEALMSAGRGEESIEQFRRAIEVARRIAIGFPDEAQVESDWVTAQNRLGRALGRAGRDRESIEACEAAVAAFQKLIEQNKATAFDRREQIDALHNIGIAQMKLLAYDQARATFERSEQLAGQLVQEMPDDSVACERLVLARVDLGDVRFNVGEVREASAFYESARDAWRRLPDGPRSKAVLERMLATRDEVVRTATTRAAATSQSAN